MSDKALPPVSPPTPLVEEMGERKDTNAREGKDRALPSVLLSVGGILGAIAASACCILPLAFISVGITGAWMSNLTALEPFRPAFIGVTAVLLAAAFVFAYRKPKVLECQEGQTCGTPVSRRVTRVVLWIAIGLFLIAVVFPYAAPLIF